MTESAMCHAIYESVTTEFHLNKSPFETYKVNKGEIVKGLRTWQGVQQYGRNETMLRTLDIHVYTCTQCTCTYSS